MKRKIVTMWEESLLQDSAIPYERFIPFSKDIGFNIRTNDNTTYKCALTLLQLFYDVPFGIYDSYSRYCNFW